MYRCSPRRPPRFKPWFVRYVANSDTFSAQSGGPLTQWGPTPFLPFPDVLIRRMEAAWGNLESYSGLAYAPGKGSVVAGLRVGSDK